MPLFRLLLVAVALVAAAPSTAQHAVSLVPGTKGHSPRNLLVVGDTLYFIADGVQGGRGLWGYDAATDRAETLVEFGTRSTYDRLIAYDGALFFNADDGIHGNELWRYDPGTGQAALVADLRAGSEGSTPTTFAVYDGKLYFQAVDEEHGSELRSYHTGEGVRTIERVPGPGGPFLTDSAVLDGRLYLLNGTGLISYDQTTGQFTTLVSLFDENRASILGELTVYDDRLYVQALTQAHGAELWSYDPATDDFGLVADIVPGPDSSNPLNLTPHDGVLYFLAFDDEHGGEFWLYDGSGSPTLVADINPGTGHSVASAFTPFDGRLYFHATDGTAGAELWVYDPATNEVALAADLAPGSESSSPSWMTPYASALYVAARHTATGGALWRVEHTPATSEENAASATLATLHPAFPNPSAGAPTLRFEVPVPEDVRLEVFDLLGRRVALLADGPYKAGSHAIHWNRRDLASGIYFVRFQAGEVRQTRRIALVR